MAHPEGRWEHPSWATSSGVAPDAMVRCPACRRSVRADMLRDLRMLPALGQDFGCDGCVTRLERAGVLSPLDYATAAGAPPHILAHLAAKDGARRVRLSLGTDPPVR